MLLPQSVVGPEKESLRIRDELVHPDELVQAFRVPADDREVVFEALLMQNLVSQQTVGENPRPRLQDLLRHVQDRSAGRRPYCLHPHVRGIASLRLRNAHYHACFYRTATGTALSFTVGVYRSESRYTPALHSEGKQTRSANAGEKDTRGRHLQWQSAAESPRDRYSAPAWPSPHARMFATVSILRWKLPPVRGFLS